MENQFKQQQEDRADEGKELKREDEMRDVSKIPTNQLPGGKSILSKIGESVSNAAYSVSDKIGLTEPAVEGHEDLDRNVRKQVKKVNDEIKKNAAAERGPEVINQWEQNESLPKVKHEAEGSADDKSAQDGPSSIQKINQSVSSKVHGISESISHGVQSLKKTLGPEPVIEGHEELDKSVRKQVRKINEEITANRAPEIKNDWEDSTLARHAKPEPENTTAPQSNKNASSSVQKSSTISSAVQGVSGSISQGVSSIKEKFSRQKEEEQPTEDDGTKHYKNVKDGINEKVDDLKHEQRVQALGQEELTSKNPFQVLSSGNEQEGQSISEKVRGGISDASQKISSTVGGATQKIKSAFVHKEANPQDKENAQQIA